jgi:hypothetical protein
MALADHGVPLLRRTVTDMAICLPQPAQLSASVDGVVYKTRRLFV